MFLFKHRVQANDLTINELKAAASHFGIEGANWDYHWLDGGRVVFRFDTEERYNAFRMLVLFNDVKMPKQQ